MGMPTFDTVWTPERVRALPNDGNRYEVIDGELLVTPSPAPSHQRVLARLHLAIAGYVDAHRLGMTYLSPADVSFDDRALVQPDLFVVPGDAALTFTNWSELQSLLLAVEILSPSTARADRILKRRLCQRWPVGEYWIVDPDPRIIERWRAGDERPEVVDHELTWQPPGAASALRLALERLLR